MKDQKSLISYCWLSENCYGPIPDMLRFVKNKYLHIHNWILHGNSYIFPFLSFILQVILMSATINCIEFAEYFGSPIRNQMNPAYVFEVEGAPYTVEEFYLDELKTMLPIRVNVWEATKLLYCHLQHIFYSSI